MPVFACNRSHIFRATHTQATDTFVYNSHGQITSQTFAGMNMGPNMLDALGTTHNEEGAGCELYTRDTALYAATLERHLDAFGNCDLSEIMADYHPNAVLQVSLVFSAHFVV